jgi:hypothetical protein
MEVTMTQSITTLAVLTALQLMVFFVAQRASSDLYFTTSSLFDRRSEVTYGAILFRLSIPFFAGAFAALILTKNEMPVAVGSGAIAWFLVLWPIVWAPSLMLPYAKRWPIVLLLLGFWGAFALLPTAGVVAARAVESLVQGEPIDWGLEYLLAVATSVPMSLAVMGLSRITRKRVSFADDLEEEEEEVADVDELIEGNRAHFAYALGIGASFVFVLAGYFWLRRRER